MRPVRRFRYPEKAMRWAFGSRRFCSASRHSHPDSIRRRGRQHVQPDRRRRRYAPHRCPDRSPVSPRVGSSGTASGWLAVPQGGPRHPVGSGDPGNRRTLRVDPALVHAVIGAESAFNPWAVSQRGQQGLIQGSSPRPPTGARRRGTPFNPRDNDRGQHPPYTGTCSIGIRGRSRSRSRRTMPAKARWTSTAGSRRIPRRSSTCRRPGSAGDAERPPRGRALPCKRSIAPRNLSDGTVIFSKIPAANQARKTPRSSKARGSRSSAP